MKIDGSQLSAVRVQRFKEDIAVRVHLISDIPSLDSRHPWSQENLPTGSDEELVYKLLTRREYDIRVWVSGDFRGWT
jgi:hypothetical protein